MSNAPKIGNPLLRVVKTAAIAAACAALAITGLVTGPAPQAAADVNVYTTPGHHTVNGRQWRTTCEQYTTKIDRCRAEIWATQITAGPRGYVQANGWSFNNLTYKPADGALWGSNPLANPGHFTSSGRQWRTDCNDSWTGANGCRTFIKTNVITSYIDSTGNRAYRNVPDQWVFNNVVQFAPGTAPWAGTAPKPTTPAPRPTTPATGACWSGVPLPSGYRITNGVPVTTTSASYNPTAIVKFGHAALTDTRTSRAQKVCLGGLAGDVLMKHATTKTVSGASTPAKLLTHPFVHKPYKQLPALPKGWSSAPVQGSALELFTSMHQLTGNQVWLSRGRELAAGFMVPISQGGFTDTVGASMWFETYPGTKSRELDGHIQASLSLRYWSTYVGDKGGDSQAKYQFDRGAQTLAQNLHLYDITLPNGARYGADNLLRNNNAAPLRLSQFGSGTSSVSASIAGKAIVMPLGRAVTPVWPVNVADTPAAQLVVSGTGVVVVEASSAGKWVEVEPLRVYDSSHTVTVPEHLTGRTYSAAGTGRHVDLLREFAFRSGQGTFDAYADFWS